jgi:hypothetical protein
MKKGTLKTLRFIAPPIIFFTLLFIASKMLDFTNIGPPLTAKDAVYNVGYLALAAIYYITPLRNWANGIFHKRVNENLRFRMVMIAGLEDDPDRFSWSRVKDVFYRRIDSDTSLKERSGDIMTNGLIWTTLADVTVLSVIFFLGMIGLWIAKFDNAPEAAVVMACIAVASRFMQDVVTARHIDMGNDQVRYMAQYHHDVIASEMSAL